MFQAEKGANAIPGYTGFIPSQELDQDILQMQGNRNHIPGYQGFVPGIRSENLFGKTFGKITLLSSTESHHRGSDLPPDLRYKSTIQDTFCDQLNQKQQDIKLYGKLDQETSQALAYTLSNLTQRQQYFIYHSKKSPEKYKQQPLRRDDKERVSSMTYEETLAALKQ